MLQTMIMLQNIGKIEVFHTVIRSDVQLTEFAGFAECTCLQEWITFHIRSSKAHKIYNKRAYLEDWQNESLYIQLFEAVSHAQETRIRNSGDWIIRQIENL